MKFKIGETQGKLSLQLSWRMLRWVTSSEGSSSPVVRTVGTVSQVSILKPMTLYRLSLPKAFWMTGSDKVSLIVLTILETVSPTQMLTDSFPLFRACIKFMGALCRTEARAHKAYFHFQAIPCPLLGDHLQTFFRTRLFE